MTDDGQGGGQGPEPALPPTPGEQAIPPPDAAASTPAPSSPHGPPLAPPTHPSTFPSQDAATIRMMPTYHEAPAVAAAPGGERRIGKYIVKRELGRGGMG